MLADDETWESQSSGVTAKRLSAVCRAVVLGGSSMPFYSQTWFKKVLFLSFCDESFLESTGGLVKSSYLLIIVD